MNIFVNRYSILSALCVLCVFWWNPVPFYAEHAKKMNKCKFYAKINGLTLLKKYDIMCSAQIQTQYIVRSNK